MDIIERLKSFVVWIGAFATLMLGWLSVKNDNELPEWVLKNKKTIIFILGFLTLFANMNNPMNRTGF